MSKHLRLNGNTYAYSALLKPITNKLLLPSNAHIIRGILNELIQIVSYLLSLLLERFSVFMYGIIVGTVLCLIVI